jgi:hypothetical protein
MSTLKVKDLIKEFSVGRSVELERLFSEGEKRGISRGIVSDSIGRMASEGIIQVKQGKVFLK